MIRAVLLALLVGTPAAGQGASPLAWSFHREVVDPAQKIICRMSVRSKQSNRLTLSVLRKDAKIVGAWMVLSLSEAMAELDEVPELVFTAPGSKDRHFYPNPYPSVDGREILKVFGGLGSLERFAAAIGGGKDEWLQLSLYAPIQEVTILEDSFPAFKADECLERLIQCVRDKSWQT